MKLTFTLLAVAAAVASCSGCTINGQKYVSNDELAHNMTATMDRTDAQALDVALKDLYHKENDGPNAIMFPEGCMTVVLSRLADRLQCHDDEYAAVGLPRGANGDNILKYSACYKRTGDVLHLRWVHGQHSSVKASTLVRPFPSDSEPLKYPKSCHFRTNLSDHYVTILSN